MGSEAGRELIKHDGREARIEILPLNRRLLGIQGTPVPTGAILTQPRGKGQLEPAHLVSIKLVKMILNKVIISKPRL